MAVQWDRANQYIHVDNASAVIPETCCKLPGPYPNHGQPLNENCTAFPETDNSYYDYVSFNLLPFLSYVNETREEKHETIDKTKNEQ